MNKLALTMLAVLVLPSALAAAAPQPVAAAETAVTAEAALTPFEVAPVEQAKPLKCGPQESAFSFTFDFLFQPPEDCEATCVTYCQDNGGYLLRSEYGERDFTCRCTCCGPR